MLINGESRPFRDGLTMHALLSELQIDQRRVAVMHGKKVYKAGEVPDVPLSPDDVIEIVKMMQGG